MLHEHITQCNVVAHSGVYFLLFPFFGPLCRSMAHRLWLNIWYLSVGSIHCWFSFFHWICWQHEKHRLSFPLLSLLLYFQNVWVNKCWNVSRLPRFYILWNDHRLIHHGQFVVLSSNLYFSVPNTNTKHFLFMSLVLIKLLRVCGWFIAFCLGRTQTDVPSLAILP